MKYFLKNNWIAILLIGMISAIYISCTTPGLTWSGFDCDLGDFLYSAKYGGVLHFPGFPIYSMLSWLMVRIPIGSESWRLAFFLSTIPAIITCCLVYIVVKKQTSNKWAPYVGLLSIAGANIFLMQAIIPEVYTFTAMFVTLTYALLVYGKFRISAVTAGLTCSMHWLTVPAIIGFLFLSKEFRSKWKYMLFSFFIPYVYTLVMGMTHDSFSIASSSAYGFVQYALGSLHDYTQWWLDLPIWQVPEKLLQTFVLLCVAFGLSLIPMVKYLFDWRNSKLLLVSIVIPLLYFFGCVTGITIVHIVLITPFLAIAAGLGVNKLKKIGPRCICTVSFILLCLLPLNYNIGRTLDKNMSTEILYNSFNNLNDGDIIVNIGMMNGSDNIVTSGRDNTLVTLYNIENDKDIVFIDMVEYCGITNVKNESNDKSSSVYRNNLYNRYEIDVPFEFNSNISKDDLYWITVDAISISNPNRDIYYTILSDDDPFGRKLVVYER